MKISYCPLLLVAAAALIGCRKESSTTVAPLALETETATEQDNSTKSAPVEFVIDVRSQEEWDSGHFKQAVLIPHTEVTERIAEVTEDKSAKIVLH